jgi:hypothetical protein
VGFNGVKHLAERSDSTRRFRKRQHLDVYKKP